MTARDASHVRKVRAPKREQSRMKAKAANDRQTYSRFVGINLGTVPQRQYYLDANREKGEKYTQVIISIVEQSSASVFP